MAANDTIGERSVVGSGLLIGRGGDKIVFHPFRDFPDYTLEFEVLYGDEFGASGITDVVGSGENLPTPKIRLRMKWDLNINQKVTGHPGAMFAENDVSTFWFSYYFETVGAREYHVFRLTYNVLAESR